MRERYFVTLSAERSRRAMSYTRNGSHTRAASRHASNNRMPRRVSWVRKQPGQSQTKLLASSASGMAGRVRLQSRLFAKLVAIFPGWLAEEVQVNLLEEIAVFCRTFFAARIACVIKAGTIRKPH